MSDAGERDGWNKAQRLVVAGAIAPSLRKASTRRVKVVDRVTGEVKREAILGEVLEGLAKAHGLEIDVECPEEFCSMYPKCRARTPKSQLQPRRVAMRKGAWKCRGCIRYDARRWEEATCASGCGRKPTRWAFLSYSKGKAWRCHPCAVGRVGDRLDPAAVECVSGCGRHPTRDGLRAARRKKAPWRCGKCAWENAKAEGLARDVSAVCEFLSANPRGSVRDVRKVVGDSFARWVAVKAELGARLVEEIEKLPTGGSRKSLSLSEGGAT